MTYEAWRISYQSSEQAARAAYAECARLQAKVKAMERQEPVATIDDVDEYGPMLTWNQHWHDLIGSKLYALPGAQTKLDEAGLWQTIVNGMITPAHIAQPAPSVPDGWKLVPIEPTKEMIQKACSDHGYPYGDPNVYARGYRSMLTVAPEAKP